MIPYRQRHPIALFLNKMMVDNKWTSPSLAKIAGVTPFHVTYLRNFATEPWQTQYLLETIRKHSRPRRENVVQVVIDLPPHIEQKLRKHKNMSAKVRQILEKHIGNQG